MKVSCVKRLVSMLLVVMMLFATIQIDVFAQDIVSVDETQTSDGSDITSTEPLPDTEQTGVVSVDSASSLQEAIALGAEEICIVADFEIDRTYYITHNLIISCVEAHTLTRQADFTGDIFVVGESADGTPCENKVVLTVGTAGAQQNDMLTINGNAEAMTADVKGTVFFSCLNGQVDLHPDVTVTNCLKKGNERALESRHTLSNSPGNVGGAVGIIANNSQMNIYGGKYTNNGVVESGLYGGAFFNHGTLNVYDGIYTGNFASRAGVFYNYRSMIIEKGVLENNSATTNGGAIYLPSSSGAILHVGGDTKTESAQVIFKNNTAGTNGGAISSSGTLVLRNVMLEQNTATNSGGAIYGVGAYDNISIYDSTLQKNSSGENGGAISISGTRTSVNVELLVYDTLFSENSSTEYGGAVCIGEKSRAYLRDVTFNKNSAVNGGALYAVGSSPELNSVTFTNNTSTTNGGGIYLGEGAKMVANAITAKENSAKNAGFLYGITAEMSMYNSSICNNTADNGSAMRLYTSMVANLYNCVINDNTCRSSNTSNAGALFIYTSGTKVTLNQCTLNNNTSSGLGGAILCSGKSLLDMFDVNATGNTASKGGFMYETAAGTVVTVSGLTVSKNTASSGGPIIWGNTLNAKLLINKNNYTDKDTTSALDDAYWAAAIYNKLTVTDSDAQIPEYEEYEQPIWDSEASPDVKTAKQLELAINSGYEEIRILRSFKIDRTYYISNNTHITCEKDVTLVRSADFGGDIFVVGESADGTSCADGVTLTLGAAETDNSMLIIDGNKDNMTTDVTGCVFFVCSNSRVNLHSNTHIKNCEKSGNNKAVEKQDQLSVKPQGVGGAVAIVAEQSEMNIDGCSFSNNTSVETDGGVIFSCGTLNISNSTFSDNWASDGGAVYACLGTLNINNTTFSSNTADNSGGAVALKGNVMYESTDVNFSNNTSGQNGGAMYISTDVASTLMKNTLFSTNTVGENGGAIYTEGFSVVELHNTTATDNIANYGAVIYANGPSVDITINGMTVNNNKATTAGDLIYGNSSRATLWLDKDKYTDQDENVVLDEEYWKKAIAGSIKAYNTNDTSPEIDGTVVDVSSSKQLEDAINNKSRYIRIVSDFEVDRTYYITAEITIFSDEAHTLTREANFGGDIFVVGETYGGSKAYYKSSVVKLTLGNPGSAVPNMLIIDGNMDNMQATVKGSVFFVCYGGSVDLYDNVTIRNCYKQDNEKTYNTDYQLSRPNRIGGSVAVISNGTVTVYGGNYKNNKINIEDSSTEEGRNSSIGGVFYNEGNLFIHGGTFDSNEGARGAIVYNYQTVKFTAGTFINNNATKYGALYYAPSSAATQVVIGNTDEDGEKLMVKGNTAHLGAGAVYSSHFSAVLILGNTSFRYNTVDSGNGGVVSVVGAFTAKNTEFIGNRSSGDGGALYLSRSENDEITRLMNVSNCTFKENHAKHGGAIFVTSAAAQKYSKGAKATIADCYFERNKASGEAGAIYVINKSQVNLVNNTFSENTATSHGGALSIRSAWVSICGDQFINNTTKANGGAMYLAYSSAMDINAHVTIDGAIYKQNSGVYGGAFYMTRRGIEEDAVLLDVKNTTFEKNHASKDGGVCLLNAGVKTKFANVNFVENNASDEAGAVSVPSNSVFEMDGGTFTGNTAKYGGGIRIASGGSASIYDINATENTATSHGGLIYNEGGVLNIYDSTISNNSAVSGGAMYLYTGALSNIYKTTFENNTTYSGDNGNGGALFIYTGNTKTVVHSCSFLNNETTGLGGAMYISGESIAQLYNNTATANKATKGGFLYITKANTVVDLVGVTVSENTATDGGNIIWGNTLNAVLNIDKSKYTDKATTTLDEAYWASAIENLLTVNEITKDIPPYEEKIDPVDPPSTKKPVSVEDVFKLGKKSSDASIDSSYDKLKRLDTSSNLMSRSTANYPNINGKTVTVDTYVYPTNGKADNGIVGLGILLYQSLLYKKANPEEEMYIDVSSYRFSVQAAININRNSRYFGYERDLVGKNYDEYGFVRLSYLLITAAKMGIHVNVIGQLDGYPISKSNPNFYEYFTQQLEDPCDPKYADGKVIGDYLDFNFCYWTLDAKGGTDMMHNKMCAVSHYLDMNGKAHRNAVWSSSSNLDGVKPDGRNANWKQQTATTITNHDELYRISVNYMRLISSLCGQEEVIEFQDTVNERSTKQIDLLLQGRGDEIPDDEQIVYLGTENDSVFELYFTPLGGGRLAWSEKYNPYCKYFREMYDSEDYIIFNWSAAEYSGKFTLGAQLEDLIIKAFHENKNPKNKIFSHMESFDASTFDDLVVGKDIGFKSFMERPNGQIHNKDVQLSYVKDGQRYFVTLLNSLNVHSGSMYYQSNFILVVKEKSCAENGVFSTIARYSTTGDLAAHTYGKEKTVSSTSTKEGYSYRECIYCKHKMVEQNVDMTKVNGVTFTKSTSINVDTNITTTPRTLEARIQIPKSMDDRVGIIVGNYSTTDTSIVNLEGSTKGRIKLYIKNNDEVFSHTFKKDVRSSSPVDIAVTISSNQATLYVNGTKTESVTLKVALPALTHKLKVGGDNRKNNEQYFKGRIYNVHLFATERSASQIRKDHLLVCRDADGLIYSEYYTDSAAPTATKLDYSTFSAKKLNRLSKALSAAPKTIEATIALSNSVKGRGGVIFGNYNSSYKAPINVEIAQGGKVRLYFKNGGKTVSHIFKTDVRTKSGTTHIALTLSGKNATLYINGVKKETVKFKVSIPNATKNFCVGGDNRKGNAQYFKGKIYSVNVFSDVRTSSEIKRDYRLVDCNTSKLIYSAYMTPTSNTKATLKGMTFSADSKNEISTLKSRPYTIEATVALSKSVKDRAGVVFGNYSEDISAPLNLEIYSNGRPRLYFKNGSKTVSHIFKSDVRTNSGTTHIALTVSGKTATLYLNGVKKETATLEASIPNATKKFCIGGDNRKGNTQYFRGKIYSVNVFSDVRTAAEIKKDAIEVTVNAASVLYSAYFCNDPCGISCVGKSHTVSSWKTAHTATSTVCGIKQKKCSDCGKVLAVKEVMKTASTTTALEN